MSTETCELYGVKKRRKEHVVVSVCTNLYTWHPPPRCRDVM